MKKTMTVSAKIIRKKPKLRTDESGVASFMVTLVLMLVITLIILGFAQIARRDQREALDDQLSTQAFYAAETGVNLVQKLMQTNPISTLRKTTCPSQAVPYNGVQLNNPNTQVSNSCLLVDTAPTSLVYGNIGTNSTVVPLQPDVSGYGAGTLTITWNPKSSAASDNLASCPAYSSFSTTAKGGWPATCPFGVLRFDLVDTTAAGTLTAQNLQNQTMTVFAPPATSPVYPIVKKENGAVPFTFTAANGKVTCNTASGSYSCSLTVSNVNFDHTHYLRLTSLYKDVTISNISGEGSRGQAVSFVGAQIEVDSTGKAVDVLRRIQVRLDENNQLAPSNAIQSTTGICKLYTTDGSSGVNTGVCP